MKKGLPLVILLLLGGWLPLSGQAVAVTGTVVDSETAGPLSGAAVSLLSGGTTIGPVQTNATGQFQLQAAPGRYTVVVRIIGYQAHSDLLVVGGTGAAGLRIALSSTQLLLDDIIVSATGVREKLTEAPAGGHTIGSDEIMEQPSPNFASRLASLSGVDVAMTGMGQSNIVARGFNNVFSGAMLVLVDNRIARVPSLRLNAYNMIPTNDMDIDRMEVVLGPGAALYGPSSANGVLHILTKSPLDYTGTSVSLLGGGQSLFQGTFRTAHRLSENVGVKVSGNWMQADDWEFVDQVEVAARAQDSTIPARSSDSDRWSLDGRVDWRPWDDGQVVFAAGRNLLGNSVELTGAGAGQALDWAYTYAQVRVQKGRLFAQLFTNSSDAGDSFFLRTGNPIVDKSRTIAAQVQHSRDLFDQRLELVYGFDYETITPKTGGTITGRNEADDEIIQAGGYLHGRFDLTESLDLVGALRIDHNDRLADDADVNYSPRAALVWNRREGESFRLTYNRAFSPPTSNNLFLDLSAATLPIIPGISYDVRIRGVPATGFTFSAACPGGIQGLCMQSPLAAGPVPADATPFWNTLVAAGVPAALQPLLLNPGALPSDPDLASRLLWFNQVAAAAGDLANAFVPDLGEVRDINPILSTITNVYEVGYRGTFGERFLVAANLHQNQVENFVGPLRIETPNVFLDPAATQAFVLARLGPAIQGGQVTVEQATAIITALASAPIGTVVPDGADATDLILTYRNFGDVDFWGSDVEVRFLATPELTVGGSYSYVSQDCFDFNNDGDCFSGEDIALNATRNKGSVMAEWDNEATGVSVGGSARFNDGFPMNSGVYVGDVEEYSVVDANIDYRLPWMAGASVSLTAYNLFDDEHQEFVGAPALGRLFMTRLTFTF